MIGNLTAMQEEGYIWGKQVKDLWRVTRSKGKWRFVLLNGTLKLGCGAALVSSVVFTIIRGAMVPFPWDILMVNFALWPVTATLAVILQWGTYEKLYKNSEKAEQGG